MTCSYVKRNEKGSDLRILVERETVKSILSKGYA